MKARALTEVWVEPMLVNVRQLSFETMISFGNPAILKRDKCLIRPNSFRKVVYYAQNRRRIYLFDFPVRFCD